MSFNKIIKKCVSCGRNYLANRKKASGGIRSVGRRAFNSVTCSRKCSKINIQKHLQIVALRKKALTKLKKEQRLSL